MSRRYFPEKINIVTSADEAGMIFDIERITGESLFNYKKRILESSTKIANSGYHGLLNGINRELGLQEVEAIEIKLRDILKGRIDGTEIQYSGPTLSDTRSFNGSVDGVDTHIFGKKFQVHGFNWEDNYLVSLSVFIGSEEYRVISNENNVITLDREPGTLHVNESFSIRANWRVNSFIGYTLRLEGQEYTVLANNDSSLTLNKNINFRVDNFFEVSLSRPRVQVTASRAIFYSEYLNNDNLRIDLEIDLREDGIDTKSFAERVNEESIFFIAKDLTAQQSPLKAFTFRKTDSDVKEFNERVPASKFFKSENSMIKPGTIKFSESSIYSKEEEDLNFDSNGPYYTVNYGKGVVESKLLPSGQGEMSYVYMDFPLVINSVPVSIVDLADSETERFLFSQKEKRIFDDPREKFVSSQPKTEMIEYIAELLRVNKQSWGR